ncbi:hypothetical protein K470DRAFT_293845 [Piedraia hortae CBS 480.64]|uniref:Uncharacterized protein n=1 Tax=Piedraia hortae CBS 480.64 TaxID=1314780 RepID=A0A6A7C3L6_9PEZI|nr:hypothetical protein K470DRAFT_293845 [Piedraia hortae CBS 480.64]
MGYLLTVILAAAGACASVAPSQGNAKFVTTFSYLPLETTSAMSNTSSVQTPSAQRSGRYTWGNATYTAPMGTAVITTLTALEPTVTTITLTALDTTLSTVTTPAPTTFERRDCHLSTLLGGQDWIITTVCNDPSPPLPCTPCVGCNANPCD